VSISLEADFCVRVLDAALARHDKPEIFNTDLGVNARRPVARFSVLVRNGKDLRSERIVWLVDERVGEAIEMIDAQPEVTVRSTVLILDEQIPDSFELGKECFRDASAGMLRVVNGGVTKFGLGFRMKPVAHEMRALTRAKASSPGTMATLPARTSSRLERAS